AFLFRCTMQHLVSQFFSSLLIARFSLVLILLLHVLSGPCILRHEGLLMNQGYTEVSQPCCAFLHSCQFVSLDSRHGIIWGSNLSGMLGVCSFRCDLQCTGAAFL